MITYITAFIFYTLAMVGILLIGFIVYKKTMMGPSSNNKSAMKILDSLQIGPKKTLLVVRVKNENFLIASGAEHTTFLAKLTPSVQNVVPEKEERLLNSSKIASKKQFTSESKNNIFDEIPYAKDNLKKLYSQTTGKVNRKEVIKTILKDINKNKENERIGSAF